MKKLKIGVEIHSHKLYSILTPETHDVFRSNLISQHLPRGGMLLTHANVSSLD